LTPTASPSGAVPFRALRSKNRRISVLHIYFIIIEIVREIRPIAERIGRHDRDLSRQLKRASVAVALNVAEGSATRGGRRRNTYEIALGEMRETRACLEAAEAIGYVPCIAPELKDKLDRVIATLVKVVR
jgi:four helix bundle protein